MKGKILLLMAVALGIGRGLAEPVDSVASRAEKGDAAAQNLIGEWYYRGEHFEKNPARAVQWWLRSADADNPKATANLSDAYRRGSGVKADTVRSMGLLKRAVRLGGAEMLDSLGKVAEKGDSFIALSLADIYKEGLGKGTVVPRPKASEQKKYLIIASQDQNPKVLTRLGLLHMDDQEYTQAYDVFQRLSRLGDSSADFWIGKMLLEGKGVATDKSAGIKSLEHSWAGGFPMAAYYLGRCYDRADGVKADDRKAFGYYLGAARKGNHYAQYTVGRLKSLGIGCTLSPLEALHWYERAAHKGHRTAFVNMVNDTIAGLPFSRFCYGMKLARAKDFDGALEQFGLMETAECANSAQAMQALIYANPLNPDHDYKKAIQLLQKPLKSNDPTAILAMGIIYVGGLGVEADPEKGYLLISQAAEAGVPEAIVQQAMMLQKGEGVEADPSKAAILYGQAAEIMPLTLTERKAWASIYAQGQGSVQKDTVKAKEIMEAEEKDLLPDLLAALRVAPSDQNKPLNPGRNKKKVQKGK